MEDDIKSAKEGALSKGTEVIIPKTAPLSPLPEVGSQTGPKPAPRAPLVRIGEAEKSSLLPGIRPPAPPVPKKEAELPKAIAVPPKKGGFLGRTTILALVGLVLVGGAAYWFFIIRQTEEPSEVIPTFTPRVIATPDPLKELKNFFLIDSNVSLPDSLNITNSSSFKSTLLQTVSDDQILHSFMSLKDNAKALKLSEFIKIFVTNQQEETSSEIQSLLNAVEEDKFGLVLSKQTEKFDSSGQLVDNFITERRVGLIVKVSDLSIAKQAMLDWEINLPLDTENFFELDNVDNIADLAFGDNIYREVFIRFINFPYPDRSIDYAFIAANDGNQYLIFANSRAQMYGVIDTLLGF